MSHYFTNDENLRNEELSFTYSVGENTLFMKSNSGVFSKSGIDFGTDLMIHALKDIRGNVLDLGCGYGIVGLSVMKLFDPELVVFSDVNERALALTKDNLARNRAASDKAQVILSDGFAAISQQFDFIITNPPIRIGKEAIFNILGDAYGHLKNGGSLYLVIQKKHGAASYEKRLVELFGSCETVSRKKQVFVFKCTKAG